MNWTIIFQDMLSNVFTFVICGMIGYLIYYTGFKAKDLSQIASERKHKIYIPLKYELEKILNSNDTIWQEIEIDQIKNVVNKNDELVISDYIFKKCYELSNIISDFNEINLYRITGIILHNHFEVKYNELYGKSTYTVPGWDENINKEIEYKFKYQEIDNFAIVSESKETVDTIFEFDHNMIDHYRKSGFISPLEDYLTLLFGNHLPKNESLYNDIIFDNIDCPELKNKEITPAEYITLDFDFLTIFYDNDDVKKKRALLDSIKKLAFLIHEDITHKIITIGKKYELE